jgi:hypothetical protein
MTNACMNDECRTFRGSSSFEYRILKTFFDTDLGIHKVSRNVHESLQSDENVQV